MALKFMLLIYQKVRWKNWQNRLKKKIIHRKIDGNTILKTEECELDIPHYYTNAEELRSLLKDFQIIKMRQIEDIMEEKSGWQYFVNIRKLQLAAGLRRESSLFFLGII